MQYYQFYHLSQLNKTGLLQFTSQHTTERPMIYTLSDHHISIWVPNKTRSTLNGQKAPYIFNSSTKTAIHENPKIAGLELIMVGGSLRPPPLLWSGLVRSIHGLNLEMVVVRSFCYHLRKASSHTRARWSLPHFCKPKFQLEREINKEWNLENKTLYNIDELILYKHIISENAGQILPLFLGLVQERILPTPYHLITLQVFRPIFWE